jgi:simple sugar transport system ATP-binding protein
VGTSYSDRRGDGGGRDLTDGSTRSLVDAGVSFVPEDRHEYGCAEGLAVMHDAALK